MKFFSTIYAMLFVLVASWDHPVSAQNYFPPTQGNEWATIDPSSLGWCTEKLDELYSYLAQTNTKSFIVLKDGKIVLEKYFDTFTQDSIWYWASAGKSLTSVLVGIANEDGSLNLNDKTSKYLGTHWTNLPIEKEDLITIQHQITMTTGLNDSDVDVYCTLPSCLTYKADAGSRWAYHNAPYTLLDGVLEKATGKNINAFLYQKMGLQTGITGLYVKSGYNNIFFSKPRVMARFGILVMNNGIWSGKSIYNNPSYFDQMTQTSQNLNLSYGYLWWLNGKASAMVPQSQIVFPRSISPDAPADMYSALGKNGQILNIIPSQNMIMVRMGDEPNAGEVPFLYNNDIWVLFNKVLCKPSNVIEAEGPSFSAKLSPNPVYNNCNISLENQSMHDDIHYQICNGIGQVVKQGWSDVNQFTINLQELTPDVYIISLQQNGKMIHEKIVKM